MSCDTFMRQQISMSCSKRTRLKRYATDCTQGLVRPRLKVNALNVVEPTTRTRRRRHYQTRQGGI
jgi:hypothetical protein